jgi:hypothetical protein
MAESSNEKNENVLLVAQVRAHLLSGEPIDLLPFKHPEDVRAEVNKFIEDWSKTGFLLQRNFLYPWNQVRLIEVLSVQEMSKAEAEPFLAEWRKDSEAQSAFWKTRKPQQAEKKEAAQPSAGGPH